MRRSKGGWEDHGTYPPRGNKGEEDSGNLHEGKVMGSTPIVREKKDGGVRWSMREVSEVRQSSAQGTEVLMPGV